MTTPAMIITQFMIEARIAADPEKAAEAMLLRLLQQGYVIVHSKEMRK